MGPEGWSSTLLDSSLGVNDRCRWRRLGASDNPGATPANKRLVRPILRHFSMSVDRVRPKYVGITLSGWARFGIAFLIMVIGRLVLKIEGRGNFLPG